MGCGSTQSKDVQSNQQKTTQNLDQKSEPLNNKISEAKEKSDLTIKNQSSPLENEPISVISKPKIPYVEKKPNNEAAGFIAKASEFEKQGKKDEAMQFYAKAAKADPLSFTAWYYAGAYCFDAIKDNKKSIEFLLKASELNPEHLYTLLTLANAFLNIGDNKQAENYMVKVIEIEEEQKLAITGWVLNALGGNYLWDEGLKNVPKAIDLMSKYYMDTRVDKEIQYKLRYWLACAYKESKENDSFVNLAKKIVDEEGFCPKIEFQCNIARSLAEYYNVKGDNDSTRKYGEIFVKLKLSQINKENDMDYMPYWEIGNMYHETMKDSTKCIEFYRKAVALNQSDAHIQAVLGLALFETNQFEESVEWIIKAIKINEKNCKKFYFWYLRVVCNSYLYSMKSKEPKKALEWIEKYKECKDFTDAECDELLNWQADAYFMLKDAKMWIPLGDKIVEKGTSPVFQKLFAERLAEHYWEIDADIARKYTSKYCDPDFYVCKLLRDQRITFRYKLNFKKSFPAYYKDRPVGKYIFPIAEDRENQKLVSFNSNYKFDLIKEPPYNAVEYDFTTTGFPENLEITMVVDLKAIQHRIIKLESITNPSDPFYEDATYCDPYFDWNNPDFVKKCQEITTGCSSVYEKFMKFCEYMKAHFLHNLNNPKYKTEVSPGVWKILDYKKVHTPYKHGSDIIKTMTGCCHEASVVFMCMLRTIGIPCRLYQGSIIYREEKGPGDEHDIVEVYDVGAKKWFYLEPQGYGWFCLYNNKHVKFGEAWAQKKFPNSASIYALKWYEKFQMDSGENMFYEVTPLSKT